MRLQTTNNILAIIASNLILVTSICIGTRNKPTLVTEKLENGETNSNITSPLEVTCSFPTDKLVCVDDYKDAVNKYVNINARVFYGSAADEEITYRDNILAYKRLIMRPHAFIDVSQRKISTKILGKPVHLPIGVSPFGSHKLGCYEGEVATAKAAADAGTIFILSTFSNTKIEDVVKGAPNGRKWMQVYFFKKRNIKMVKFWNRAVTVNLIRRAESLGFEAVVATMDSPVFGFKRSQKRLPVRDLALGHFGPEMGDLLNIGGRPTTDNDLINNFDDDVTVDDIIWLKSVTRLPIFLKGILNADDAETGIKYGATGIYVSNHGGRQLDTDIATIDVLPQIVKRLKPYNATVIVDGGIRKGTDIFKALAFGANMVFAGRPFAWGLSVAGRKGVENIFNIFRNEFNNTMALAGVISIDKINANHVGRSISPQPL